LAPVTGCARGELLGGRVGLVRRTRRQVDVDEYREQRRGGRARCVDLFERAIQQVDREGGVAPRDIDGGERPSGVRGAVEPVKQLLRLLEPALADAQVSEPDEGAAAQRAAGKAPGPDRLGESGISLRPAAGCGEDAAVVRGAESRYGREIPPLRNR